jgi:FkbM family methyltransferase
MELNLEHFKHSYHLSPGVVIHAGASYCQEANTYHKSGFEPVFWIEALADISSIGAKNLEQYPNQKIFCETLYSVDNYQITFNRTSNEAQSSSIFDLKLHKVVHQSVVLLAKEIHNTITLSSFLSKNFATGNIALLVLDLQGAELEALKGLDGEVDRVRAIYTEVSNYKMYRHQPLFHDVHKYLLSKGFCLIAHDMGGTTFMGDALYVTKSHAELNGLEAMSPPKMTFNFDFYLQRVRFKLIALGIPKKLLKRPFKKQI